MKGVQGVGFAVRSTARVGPGLGGVGSDTVRRCLVYTRYLRLMPVNTLKCLHNKRFQQLSYTSTAGIV